MSERYLPLDDEGYFWFDGRRLDDAESGGELARNLRIVDRGRLMTSLRGQDAWVEAFDAPLVARHVSRGSDGRGRIDLAYERTAEFTYESLSLDEWDRFHGRTTEGLPFVFSRTAQFEFFDLLEGFDDDTITVEGRTLTPAPWLGANAEASRESFWSDRYRGDDAGWDLGREAPALGAILPQLKLSRSRILVLGSGLGHDAAFLARQGHNVTAIDFSPEAVQKARQTYAGIEGLDFSRGDAFNLPEGFNGRFDIVFEHTCYCAIDPAKRNDLVRAWRRALGPQGHLLGIFFVTERPNGPPFGGSEWEIRERLKTGFHSLFWTRWRHSIEKHRAAELVVYARKR